MRRSLAISGALGVASATWLGCFLTVDTDGLAGELAEDAGPPPRVDAGDANAVRPEGSGPDAPPTSIDSGPPPARCDRARPFGAPTLVGELSSGGEDQGLQLSADELTATFGSDRAGTGDLYTASRSSRDQPFSTPVMMIGTPAEERAPTMSADGLTVLYTLGLHLVEAKRATPQGTFGAPVTVDVLNSPVEEGDGFLTADGAEVWFASRRAGDWDLYQSARQSTGVYGTPQLAYDLSIGGVHDGVPVLSFDRRTLYFTSRRVGNEYNIYVTQRSDTSRPFSVPQPVTELNSAFTDRPSWISADECVIYLVSARNGTWDFWVAKRP